jgi:hypothetical protein
LEFGVSAKLEKWSSSALQGFARLVAGKHRPGFNHPIYAPRGYNTSAKVLRM